MQTNQDITLKSLALFCAGRNTVIDIGCGNGQFLIPMIDLDFQKLIGIDSSFDYNLSRTLKKYLEKSRNMKPEEALEFIYKYKPLLEYRNDYNKFPFEEHSYSFIICRNFLHLINDDEKFKLLQRLYPRLESGGVMYLELNHTNNSKIVEDQSMRRLADNVYESGIYRIKTFYLFDAELFIDKMKSMFKDVIFSEINELTVKVAIKK